MMKLEKSRHLIIAFKLLRTEGYCSSEMLAKAADSSTRTIKSDMLFLGDLFKENGGKIISKKSDGYSYQIVDEECFAKFRKRVYLLNYYYISQGDFSSQTRFLHIIRRILSSLEPVKIDDIADELYISRSAMKAEMAKATSFAESYNLEIASVAGKGIWWKGNEDDFRLCAIAAYGITYHDYQKQISVPAFSDLFASDYEEYQAVRRIMLTILRKLKYRIRDEHSQSIARYLVLMKNRMNDGFLMRSLADEKKELKQFQSYTAAKNILEEVDSFFDVKPNEDELLFLAKYLLCSVDLTAEEITEQTLHSFYEPTLDINSQLVSFIRHRWGMELDRTGFDAFLPLTANYVIESHFHFLPHPSVVVSSSSDDVKKSPIAMAIGQSIINNICRQLSCKGNRRDDYIAANIAYDQFNRLSLNYHKLKIAVVSSQGRQNGIHISNAIRGRFQNRIASIHAYELYEIREVDPSQLDYVILDNPNYVYNYGWPVFHANRRSIEKQYHEMWKQLFVNGYMVEESCTMLCQYLKIYENFEMTSRDGCYRQLAYKYGENEHSSGKIYEWICKNEERSEMGASEMIFIDASYELTKRNTFDIYKLKNPITSKETCRIKYVVFSSLDFSKNTDILLLLKYLMEAFAGDTSKMEAIISVSDSEKKRQIKEYIMEELKNISC
ncbi:MAG: PRD domain-containing protein [Erysipelotrichia bacterium]|nr:PRD domain-containing protein [Erysipelotrichia bacterium]